MNPDFPPLSLPQPQSFNRRKVPRPRDFPVPPEEIERRRLISSALLEQIEPLAAALKEMSDDERKAVFYKLEHDDNIPIVGTGLKPIIEPTKTHTLAIARDPNLDSLINKITEFGEGALKDGRPKNAQLAVNLQSIEIGKPSDRLSQPLLNKYDEIVKLPQFTFEIEVLSLRPGRRQQQEDIRQTLEEINQLMKGGREGRIVEFEEIKGTCRAVVRCSGEVFRELVEGRKWQVKISWFDARPESKPFASILREFDINNLGEIESPADDAPVICIVDSGVTPGNPFLEKVTKDEYLKSFLDPAKFDPYDAVGHGSGVASLAAYYALDLNEDAHNPGRFWIASARILDESNGCDERLISKMLREVVEAFVPLGIKIFNLLVNVINQNWNEEAKRTIPRKSWTARAIDKLSREFDVVFVLSSGNLNHDTIDEHLQNGEEYPDYLTHETASLLDPAQASLGITVGSIAAGTLVVHQRIDTEFPIADVNEAVKFLGQKSLFLL